MPSVYDQFHSSTEPCRVDKRDNKPLAKLMTSQLSGMDKALDHWFTDPEVDYSYGMSTLMFEKCDNFFSMLFSQKNFSSFFSHIEIVYLLEYHILKELVIYSSSLCLFQKHPLSDRLINI